MSEEPGMPSEAAALLRPRQFALLNAVISGVALGFLTWLVYFHEPADAGEASKLLPTLNATFNAIAATLLCAGYRAIRGGHRRLHQQLMMAALGASALFLINYVYYHSSQGDTHFTGTGIVRPVYYAILISHVLLSVVIFPIILTTIYLALSGRLALHKRLARFTLAGWLYVSVTGVLIFFMLHVIAWP
jgi:putative membrane protein